MADGSSMRVNRRRLLTGGAAALAAGAVVTASGVANSAVVDHGFGTDAEPFYGPHQAGIATAPQAHGVFLAFDVKPTDTRSERDTVAAILRLWTVDAARLTAGRPAVADTEPELATRPARLTVTVGLGPGLLGRLGATVPRSARDLPEFGPDRLQERWSGGDLLLQICGDDPVSIAHATRVLTKNVRAMAVQRWRQAGFRNARGADRQGTSMRNLMGQVDGTVNLAPVEFDELVWLGDEVYPGLAGGTLMVLRRIEMQLDTWDELDRESKELTVGRTLDSGAPLTGHRETDEPDFTLARNGIPVIPPNSHIALARHRHDGERFLRRPYNYDDPPEPGQTSNTGLIFATYQRDIDTQFLPVQQRLAQFDALNQWTTAIGSSVFVILPGVRSPEGYLGQELLAG
ncbi:Dyp-type peroxidase [Mycolicibacterium smegmatis]|uniref:Iron-dependent peroxidase n=3 Tax=Mycolicibacterium smegmatis TaxID=1772 RepID=A0R6J2_MYCS2|nr:Dyp-type peroxidase [Mycolicibacterium smegmatis]ABK72183.1 iron-dependent peroxidase [Mycolicibacterium smegmatis MC2 155]AIU11542.1 peroxidase [Mycolicibacterium smegmatis MC2 155]AIU18167.1 peroxidase [Mycolicibacterium smegmatis]AIU24789.1 peroxidase [Mycolicibacterium smegmatis]MBE9622106.1 Dyp-type peroxidase [Mycolicibacterium smegmatis]